MEKKYIIKKHFVFITILIFVWTVYGLCGISCPIKHIFGISCPTCGVTRAMIAILKGDFVGYLSYNPNEALFT